MVILALPAIAKTRELNEGTRWQGWAIVGAR